MPLTAATELALRRHPEAFAGYRGAYHEALKATGQTFYAKVDADGLMKPRPEVKVEGIGAVRIYPDSWEVAPPRYLADGDTVRLKVEFEDRLAYASAAVLIGGAPAEAPSPHGLPPDCVLYAGGDRLFNERTIGVLEPRLALVRDREPTARPGASKRERRADADNINKNLEERAKNMQRQQQEDKEIAEGGRPSRLPWKPGFWNSLGA